MDIKEISNRSKSGRTRPIRGKSNPGVGCKCNCNNRRDSLCCKIFVASILLLGLMTSQGAGAASCSDAKVTEVLQKATENNKKVIIDCDLTLKASDLVTKQIILQSASASNSVINCNGATLNGKNMALDKNVDTVKKIII